MDSRLCMRLVGVLGLAGLITAFGAALYVGRHYWRPQTVEDAIRRGDPEALRGLLGTAGRGNHPAVKTVNFASIFFSRAFPRRERTATPRQWEHYRQVTFDMASVLLDHGVHPDQGTLFGAHAIHCAIKFDMEELARLLLRHGASLSVQNADGHTPIMCATWLGRTGILEFLLQHDAQRTVNWQDNEGNTALHFAAELGDADAIRLLLEYGADPQLENLNGERPIDSPLCRTIHAALQGEEDGNGMWPGDRAPRS